MRNQYVSKLLPLWLFLALGGSAVAVQNNWTGAGGDMLWTNAANWSLGVLPDSTQDIFIGDTSMNAVLLDTPITVASLSLGSNAVLKLNGAPNEITCGTCTNLGNFILQTDGTLWAGTFLNEGTLRVPANSGIVTLTITNAAFLANHGTLMVETNSVLKFTHMGERFALYSGTAIAGEGVVRFVGVGGFSCFGNITVNGTVEEAGRSINGNNYIWSGTGVFRWLSGRLREVTFGTNFHVELSGPDNKTVRNVCTNLGICTLQTNTTLAADDFTGGSPTGVFINVGTLRVPDNVGDVTLTFGDPGASLVNLGTLQVETNSTLVLINNYWGHFEFQSGTIFDGAGLVRLDNGGFFFAGDITVNGTLECLAGIYGDSTWHGPGLFRWVDDMLSGITFGPDFHVETSGPDFKYISSISGPCTNLGTFRWLTEAPLQCSASFENAGLFIMETNCYINSDSGKIFSNPGTIRVPADRGDLTLWFSLLQVANTGTLLVETNSTLVIRVYGSELVEFQSGTIFDGAGVVRLFNGGFFCSGNVTVNNTVELAGQSTLSTTSTAMENSQWGGSGLFRWLGGAVNSLNFGPDFHVEMTGPDEKILNRPCTNLGTFRWLQDSPVRSYGAPDNASFLNGGLFLVEADGAWTNDITFTNLSSGTFRQATGNFSIEQLHNDGALELHGGMLNVVSNFVAAPGSNCKIPLRGYSPGTDFGQLQAGDLTLAGSLIVTLTNGFAPTNGSVFLIATNGVRHGQFASTALPPLAPELLWQTSYQPMAVMLQVTTPPSLSEAAVLPDGSFQFTLTGSAGGTYQIQASTNLVDWLTLTNAPFSGSAVFIDPAATNFIQRFYRGVVQGP